MNDELVSTEIERSNGSLIIHLSGEIDLSNAHDLQQQLENSLEGSPAVVIDLTEIVYLDSQGLRLIKQLVNKANREGTRLQLVAPPNNFARQVLEVTQMSDYIEIRDTLDK
jgi:anti-sigma B factor antagonist